MSTETVTIDRLGAQGDGIADMADGLVYVPFTLPGETVTITRQGDRGRLTGIDRPSPTRIDPPCPFFGPRVEACGGCVLQHMDASAYREWKRQRVVDALQPRRIDSNVDKLVACAPGSRRRAVFTARKTSRGLAFGFNRAGTHHIVPIDACLVISPAIARRLGALRSLAATLTNDAKPFQIAVLETETGLDVTVRKHRLSEKQRRAASDAALRLDLARLSLNEEVLIEARKPLLDFSGVSVTPPPDAFVQASRHAQDTMTERVARHLSGAKKVTDLFAGCGAFAFGLATGSHVHAVESNGPALAALDAAARRHPGLKPISVERRDLFRRPLMTQELKGFDGVVFDPPRAGAQAQAAELAKSAVGRVAAVSCNPATLARDLRILVDGGFRVTSVTPIDQFLWSAHVEAVALLER